MNWNQNDFCENTSVSVESKLILMNFVEITSISIEMKLFSVETRLRYKMQKTAGPRFLSQKSHAVGVRFQRVSGLNDFEK